MEKIHLIILGVVLETRPMLRLNRRYAQIVNCRRISIVDEMILTLLKSFFLILLKLSGSRRCVGFTLTFLAHFQGQLFPLRNLIREYALPPVFLCCRAPKNMLDFEPSHIFIIRTAGVRLILFLMQVLMSQIMLRFLVKV